MKRDMENPPHMAKQCSQGTVLKIAQRGLLSKGHFKVKGDYER